VGHRDLLTDVATLDTAAVVMVLDAPADEMPWLALHPAGEAVGHLLRLGKRPVLWTYRPLAWPVWNHQNRRLVRFWSAADGVDDDVIDALRQRTLDRLPVVSPTDAELAAWLPDELAVSRRHLRTVLDRFWDRDWRDTHRTGDGGPQDHLWRAATAVEDMTDALAALER
jgi:hypothetical protein